MIKNWWYYHKWYVICGISLLVLIGYLIGNAFGWFQKTPDLQIAYVGKALLPEDTVTALERAFASYAEDYNQDGEVLVQLNQYVRNSEEPVDADTAYYHQASEIALIGDISDCESYFFLLEEPEGFQKEFQILAMADGSCPDTYDYSTEDKVLRWDTLPSLSQMDLGNYTITLLGQTTSGKNQELLASLYMGRRCFYTEAKTPYTEACAQLWERLKGDA